MSTRPFLGEPLGPGQGDSVDVAFAYTRGSGAWSPAHQQWCVLLSFSSVFIRTLSQHVDVEAQATDLLVAAEPRLLLACVPPAGTPSQVGVCVCVRACLQLSGLVPSRLTRQAPPRAKPQPTDRP
jgi:hypothetical protein